MRFKLYLTLCVAFSFLCVSVLSNATAKEPHPKEVKIGLYINDISQVSERAETLMFEGTFTEQWHDARLAGSRSRTYTDAAARRKVDEIWYPQISLTNIRGKPAISSEVLEIKPDGTVTHMLRVQAKIESPLNFRRFPFDKQTVSFSFEPFTIPATHLQLKIFKARQGLEDMASPHAWRYIGDYGTINLQKNPIFHKPFSRYTYSIKFQREVNYYISQIMIPLILITLFSFSVFWMMHNPLVNRVAISITTVLTIVVFQWRIFSNLPHVSYHTFLDVFMLLSLVMAAFTLVPCVIYDHMKSGAAQLQLVKTVRWMYPVVYFLSIIIVYLIFF